MRGHTWGSDTPPSAPVAPTRPRLVPFGGFCFTDGGIAHDISQGDADDFRVHTIEPYARGGDRQ